MLRKWIFLFVCILPVFGRQDPRTQSTLGKLKDRESYFKLRLHKIFEEGTRQDLVDGKKLVPTVSSRVLVNESIEVTTGCTTGVVEGDTAIVATPRNELFIVQNVTLRSIRGYTPTSTFRSLQALQYGNTFLLIAEQSSGIEVNVRMYEIENFISRISQTISHFGSGLVSAMKFKQELYIAIVSNQGEFPDLRLYQKTIVGRDVEEIVSTRIESGCSDLAIWTVGKYIYVALSYASDGKLEIKQFVESTRRMSHIQRLAVSAHIIKTYEDSGSHYLVCGTEGSVIIYWWSGVAFELSHSIFLRSPITDIVMYEIPNRLLIAVGTEHEVDFLVKDSSSQFVVAGKQRFDPSMNLKNILLWKSGANLYMLPLFKEKSLLTIYEIRLNFELADAGKGVSFDACKTLLSDRINKRAEALNSIDSVLEKVWSSSTPHRGSTMKVIGTIKSRANSSVRSLNLNINVLKTLVALRQKNNDLLSMTLTQESELSKLLLKSANQIIRSNLQITNLTVKNAKVHKLRKHLYINNLATRRLYYNTLKNKGNQKFTRNITVVNAFCINATTNLLNRNNIEDYILLRPGTCIVTGDVTFDNVCAENVYAQDGINGVALEDMVLTGKRQLIWGQKTFRSLTAESMQTTYNNVNQNLAGRVEFKDEVKFTSTLNIEGNLDITSLNSKSIHYLYNYTVKKNDMGDIYGLKRFKNLKIYGNVDIDGEINGVSLTNLMTVHTDQTVTGDVTFSTVNHYEDVFTDSLNGNHLSSEAVVRSDPKVTISGVKTFNEDLKVSNIVMRNETGINSFDPSVEISNIFKAQDLKRTSRFTNPVIVENMQANNVRARRRSLPYVGELNNVWLKTTEQNITRLKARTVKIQSLEAQRLNDINIKNLVMTREEDYIDASVTFTEDISTRHFELGNEAYLNISPEFWNPDVHVKVNGSVFIENAKLDGNLKITGDIKNFDFMYTNKDQIVKGEFSFPAIKLRDLTLPAVTFSFLNKIDVPNFLESAVLSSADIHIFNKAFSTLKGWDLECQGTLNNVMIDKVITTDTDQILKSSYQFLDSASFNAISVEKFFGDVAMDDITYVDSRGKISNKYFKETVVTPFVNASGNVGDVNVTLLQLNAFSKSGINHAKKKFKFNGSLDASEIRLAKNRSVDNVILEDLIFLNDVVEIEDFRAFSITAKRVSIYGKVNGCDIMSIYQRAVCQKCSSQVIRNRVYVNKLEIDGDLEMEYCNGGNTLFLINYLRDALTSQENKNVVFQKVKANNINIEQRVNDISVDFLLQDSVQKNKNQTVAGTKVFQSIEAKKVVAGTLQSGEVCGIDVRKMYQLSINKTEDTTLLGNLTLPGLTAKRITIKGRINSLTLPKDVVLSNSNEMIADEVIFNASADCTRVLNAQAGLSVLGKIDGIQLESFIERFVSLDGAENISSKLIFVHDSVIEGDCSIKKINGIRLDDIVNGIKNKVIKGTKTFTDEDLEAKANVMVYGLVNNTDIEHLQQSLVSAYEDEYLKDVVNFSNITMPSLVCDTINGFYVNDIYNDIELLYRYKNDMLDNFTYGFNSHMTSMSKLNAVDESLLVYKSFELHTVLDYGFIEKFLPVYQSGMRGPKYELEAVQMVMWVKGRFGETKSIIAEIGKNGTIVMTKELKGKVFPFALKLQKDGIVGFYVQETDAIRCSGKECIVIMTLYTSGLWKKTKIPSSDKRIILDAELLEVEDMTLLILSFSNAGFSDRIFVYQYEPAGSTWKHHQKFHAQNLTSISIFEMELHEPSQFDASSVYLAVTGDKNCPDVTIYLWDLNEFIHLANISTSVSTHATWVYNDGAIHLVLAKEMDRILKENNVTVNTFSEPLEVYNLEDELLLNHTVNVNGVSYLETFGFRDETFVLATSNHFGAVYILQFRGFNGLELVQEIHSPGVTETRVFTVSNHLYLAINSRTQMSKILKASVTGRIQEESSDKENVRKLFV